jgi:hypothetical protein
VKPRGRFSNSRTTLADTNGAAGLSQGLPPSSATMNRTRCVMSRLMKATSRDSLSSSRRGQHSAGVGLPQGHRQAVVRLSSASASAPVSTSVKTLSKLEHFGHRESWGQQKTRRVGRALRLKTWYGRLCCGLRPILDLVEQMEQTFCAEESAKTRTVTW